MEDTKWVHEIVVDESEVEKIKDKDVEQFAKNISEKIAGVVKKVDDFQNDHSWIEMSNGEFANFEFGIKVPGRQDEKSKMIGYDRLKRELIDASTGKSKNYENWRLPDREEAERISAEDSPHKNKRSLYYWGKKKKKIECTNRNAQNSSMVLVCDLTSTTLWHFILTSQIVPKKLEKDFPELKEELKALIEAYGRKEILVKPQEKRYLSDTMIEKIRSGACRSYFGISLKNCEDKLYPMYAKYFLDCDKRRADMDAYDETFLSNPQCGHWELWNMDKCEGKKITLPRSMSMVARNPMADIHENGLVAIDFGTKSTVVAYQDGKDITQFMRIGTGKIHKEIKDNDFENPTVMQFRNYNKFKKAYSGKTHTTGRPHTEWNDLTVSYTAQGSMEERANHSEIYSFFTNLKQWAGARTGTIKLQDVSGETVVLPPFSELKKTDCNPVELYAYYIGLYINNMNNGIYLKYLLSFPVSYDKESREKILQSFEAGIKKSLPDEILRDEDTMKKFSVLPGASEPAAYAICALEKYGLEPKDEDDAIFYGVFDFGGGTTDYDFGLWKWWNEDERYDYCIEHFGSGTNPYLGGENLLELLAYRVFCDNLDTCRENDIVFRKPNWLSKKENTNGFVSEAQEAYANTRTVMEKIRPFWEGRQPEDSDDSSETDGENVKYFSDGKMESLPLFTKDGKLANLIELKVNEEALGEILDSEIEKGVKNFFEALTNVFEKRKEELKNIEKIHIFLGGNSSKSARVKASFDKYIDKEKNNITTKTGKKRAAKDWFELYPPLGTEEAKQKQKNGQVGEDMDNVSGKTGVAYGVLEGRTGNRIKVIDEVQQDGEASFKYYLGIKKRNKFSPKIGPGDPYKKWIRFFPAGEDEFSLYYTELPEAATGELSTKEESVRYKRCPCPKAAAELDIYIRLLNPYTLEYGIGRSDKEIDGKTIQEVILEN